MNHKLTIEGATAANVDAALGMLVPQALWQGILLYKDLPDGQEWRQCSATWHMWKRTVTEGSGPEDPQGVIRTYDLPGACVVVFTDGIEPNLDKPRPALGEPFDALADALPELLQGKEAGAKAGSKEPRRGAQRLEDRPDWPERLRILEEWERQCEKRTPEGAAAMVQVPLRTLRNWKARRDRLRPQ